MMTCAECAMTIANTSDRSETLRPELAANSRGGVKRSSAARDPQLHPVQPEIFRRHGGPVPLTTDPEATRCDPQKARTRFGPPRADAAARAPRALSYSSRSCQNDCASSSVQRNAWPIATKNSSRNRSSKRDFKLNAAAPRFAFFLLMSFYPFLPFFILAEQPFRSSRR